MLEEEVLGRVGQQNVQKESESQERIASLEKQIEEYRLNQVKFLKEISALKKDIFTLQLSLRRYRKMVLELQGRRDNKAGDSSPLQVMRLIQRSKSIDKREILLVTEDEENEQSKKKLVAMVQQKVKQNQSPFRGQNVVSLTSYQKGIYRGVDVTRMEKLLESVKRLQHYKTREGVIREGLKWVKELTSSANAIFYAFENKRKEAMMRREEWTSQMSDLDLELGEQCFDRPLDSIYGVRKSHAMCYGIAGPHGTVKFILQVEYKRLKNVTKTYTLADELFFKVFVEAFGFKLEESGVEEKLKEANQKVNNTLSMCQSLSDARNHEQLIKQLRSSLAFYFRFQEIGVLLYDEITNLLFSIQEINSSSKAHTSQKIQFPCTMGVTGQCLKSEGFVYVSTETSKDQKYNSEIDNIGAVKHMKNFMMGALYKADKKPVAVIQFHNKVGGKITQADVLLFKKLSSFLAVCIENCNILANSLNATAEIKQAIYKINEDYSFEQEKNLQSIVETRQLQLIMGRIKDAVKESQEYKNELYKTVTH